MFRSLLDHHQVYKELKYAKRNEILWYAMGSHCVYIAFCDASKACPTSDKRYIV